ncbi:MAG: hypothetical protein O7B35_18935 [Deltaproteobacteria bacterium]|nr:hypothetical protein [Deltaproteobacteria bacterium]
MTAGISRHSLEGEMLEKEFKYYKDNQEKLVKKYKEKFLTIVGEEVVGVYGSELDAYTEMKKKYEVGTFLIQHCLPGKDSYTQTFHSRVSFP